MKKIFFLLLPFTLILSTCEKKDNGPNNTDPNPDDPVNIPDSVLLYALINHGVDTNGDSLISYSEARSVKSLIFGGCTPFWYPELGELADITGIEAFVNLDTLISRNIIGIEKLDLTNLTKLKYLDIGGGVCGCCGEKKALYPPGSMHNLNVTKCVLLEILICDRQSLTSLDVSNNPNLTYLDIGDNPNWEGNSITEFDLSNNINLTDITLSCIPTLNKVCVWTMPFPPAGVEVDTTGSPNVYFTTDCSK